MRKCLIVLLVLIGPTLQWHNEGNDFSIDAWKTNQGEIQTVENINDTGRDLVRYLDAALRSQHLRLIGLVLPEDCVLIECDKPYEGACARVLVDLPAHHSYSIKVDNTIETGNKIVIYVTVSSKYFDDPIKSYGMELTYNRKSKTFISIRYVDC